MAYIGRQLVRGQNRIYDDISSSFNGSTTAFNLTIGGDATPPAQVNQLWIVLGGILQKPGTDFTVADAQVTFTTAPAAGLDFWAMIQGDTSDMNAPSDGSVTPTKIATSGDFAFPADVRFKDADGSHYVGLQAPTTVSSNLVWTLPAADGSANQYLKTNGSGVLGWASDTQSNLLDEDNMSSNSATQPASQQSIKAYADTKAVLTGSTNNTITTVTGAHAIQGEANLTYDGSHLSIATDAHGEGIKLTASGDTYNGITFDANRSGADTYMGAIEAKWNGSLVSFISFETGLDTTNKDDGLIAFSTRTSGSSIAERMRLDNAGRLIIGHTTSTGQDRLFQIVGTTADTSSIELIRHSADDSCANLDFSKSRNATKGSNTVVNSGDALGQIIFRGDDGSDITTAAATITAEVDGTPGSNDMPGRLKFSTTADGASSSTERLRIDSSGHMGLGVTPSGWATNGDFRGLQVGTGASIFGRGSGDEDRGGVAVNYYSDGSNDKYIANGHSNQIYMNDGNIQFRYAAANSSGAGSNITWVNPLTITSGGIIKSANGVQSGGNTTGGFAFEGADTACVLGIQQPSSAADTNAAIQIWDGTSNNLRVNYDGRIKTATGIDFSPYGASNVNLLDDYEEGTWTPKFATSGATSGLTCTYSAQSGSYTKIGNLVYVKWDIICSDTPSGTAGYPLVVGLPFTPMTGQSDEGGYPVPVMRNMTSCPADMRTYNSDSYGHSTHNAVWLAYNNSSGALQQPAGGTFFTAGRQTGSLTYRVST